MDRRPLMIGVLFAFAIMSCTESTKSLHGVFDKQGHRGCRGLMPENTIAAMLKAIDLGVNTLEMDVCFTADMKAILSHDPYFNHDITTKPDGSFIKADEEKSYSLYKMTYDEVMRYDVGMKGNPHFPQQQKMKAVKPLLADVIEQVESYCDRNNKPRPHYNIETKTTPATDNIFHPAPAVFVDEMMNVIDQHKVTERVVVQSFDIRTLQYLHDKYPEVKISLLIEPAELLSIQNKIKRLGFQPDIVSPEYHMVNNKVLRSLHEKNIHVIPWTVNDSVQIQRLRLMGADGIISDYPNLFKG